MRARQPLSYAGAGLPVLPQIVDGENGVCYEKAVDFSKIKLPAVETTDLRACLDAGVNLKEVSSKIFGPKEIIVDMASAEPEPTQTSEEGEN